MSGVGVLQLSPESAEEYIEYLKSSDRLDEAAQRLATVVNDERFVSKAGKSNYQVGSPENGDWVGERYLPSWTKTEMSPIPCILQLWHELCDLISQNPDKVQSLNVDAIIRGGLTRFTDQLGKLWCSLADYYIRSGHFEKVRGCLDLSCKVSLRRTHRVHGQDRSADTLCVTHHTRTHLPPK